MNSSVLVVTKNGDYEIDNFTLPDAIYLATDPACTQVKFNLDTELNTMLVRRLIMNSDDDKDYLFLCTGKKNKVLVRNLNMLFPARKVDIITKEGKDFLALLKEIGIRINH